MENISQNRIMLYLTINKTAFWCVIFEDNKNINNLNPGFLIISQIFIGKNFKSLLKYNSFKTFVGNVHFWCFI